MIKTIFVNHSERPSVPKRSKESYRKVRSSGSEPRTDNMTDSAMILSCHSCKKRRHRKKDCNKLTGKSDMPSMENGTRKWCSYHHSNKHSNENCYQQQQQSGKRWGTYHKSRTHSDDQCYHQRHGSRNSSADGKSTKIETFVADSNSVTGCDKCSCNGKIESKTTEDDEASIISPGIGFGFAMCHPPLSQEAGGFQLLVDSRSSMHFIDPELIRGVESTMQEYTRIEPPMEIKTAVNNMLRGTTQDILLVVVRGTDDALRAVKLPIVVVPGLKRNLFSSTVAAKKGVKTSIEQKRSSLDLRAFSVQLTRLDSMEYLDLKIATESRRT